MKCQKSCFADPLFVGVPSSHSSLNVQLLDNYTLNLRDTLTFLHVHSNRHLSSNNKKTIISHVFTGIIL